MTEFGPDSAPCEESLEFASPFEPKAGRHVRQMIESLGHRMGFQQDMVWDLSLAAREAVANAVEHAPASSPHPPVRVRARCWPHHAVVEVQDAGPGFDPAPWLDHEPDPVSTRGRGIRLMRSLVDSLEIHSDSSGTTVRLTKSFAPQPSAGFAR